MTMPLSPTQAVLLVARREFGTQVRSRSFAIGLIITLVLFGGGFALSAYIGGQSSTSTLGVTGGTAVLGPALQASAKAADHQLTTVTLDESEGQRQVADGQLDALLTGGPGGYRLLGKDTVDSTLQTIVSTAARQQSIDTALTAAGFDPAVPAALAHVTVTTQEPVDPDRGQQLGLAIVGTILLFISFSSSGQLVATGVVEEKSSRVVELLLATIKPWQLLTGKVVGLGGVGLLQLVILAAVGVVGGTAAGLLTLPTAAAGIFAIVVLWYLIGFFLFAALYAAIGSTVSRQEELNTVLAPMIFLLIIPFVLTLNLLPNNPRNELATVLSFVPFFSQTVMPARYALGVAPLWQVGVSALLALVTVVGVMRMAGRVYRNSVLRTGARVSLREALATRSS